MRWGLIYVVYVKLFVCTIVVWVKARARSFRVCLCVCFEPIKSWRNVRVESCMAFNLIRYVHLSICECVGCSLMIVGFVLEVRKTIWDLISIDYYRISTMGNDQ